MNPGGVSQPRPKFSNDFKDLARAVKLHSEDPGGVSSLGPELSMISRGYTVRQGCYTVAEWFMCHGSPCDYDENHNKNHKIYSEKNFS